MVVFTSPIITIPLSKLNSTMTQIKYRLSSVIPQKALRKVAKLHYNKSQQVVKRALISGEAKSALITHLEYKDNKAKNLVIKVNSNSIVGGIFEKGVVPHVVNYNFFSNAGYSVAEWAESRGYNPGISFLAGGPGSTIKKPGIRFMEEGYKEASRKINKIVTTLIKTDI